MNDFWSIANFVCVLVAGLGGAVAVLEYVGIRPGHVILRLPSWTLLLLSGTLFFLSVICFRYSLYLVPHRAWLYLAVVLYLCAPGGLWLVLWRSERESSRTLRNRAADIQKAGALVILADEVDGLAAVLKPIFQWIDANDKRSRPHLEHPLDEAFRRHIGTGNWGEGHDSVTSFQEAYKAHRVHLSKYSPDLETELTKQEHSALRKLSEKEMAQVLQSHSAALRSEASRLLETFHTHAGA